MEVLSCPGCDEEINIQQKFCQHCGISMADHLVQCKTCDSLIHPLARFCPHCGEGVSQKATLLKQLVRVLFVLFLLFLVTAIAVRTTIHAPTLPERISGTLGSSNASSSSLQFVETQVLYAENSFHTLVFAGQTSHEAEIAVESPTNQVFMIQAIDQLISNKADKLSADDVLLIHVYEKMNDSTSEYRAQFVFVNTTLRSTYKFPSGRFQPLENNVYVQWYVKKR